MQRKGPPGDRATGPGFFSPYRHAGTVTPPALYPEIEKLFQSASPAMEATLALVEKYRDGLLMFGGPPPAPRFEQDWFPRLDAAVAYALVRHGLPKRIVEIGSGHSTRVMARAIADSGHETSLTSIDPQPRADLAALPVLRVTALLDEANIRYADALEDGDILFLDASHLLWPGSDVDWVLSRMLLRLVPGVMIHFHDILLPDGYPPHWQWRGYTEQLGVAALLAGGGYEIVFSSHFAVTRLDALAPAPVLRQLTLADGAIETSLWIRKTTAPVWR